MSYGLMCLTCRSYILEEVSAYGCGCKAPRPSWDAKTDAPNGSLPKWWPPTRPTEGDDNG